MKVKKHDLCENTEGHQERHQVSLFKNDKFVSPWIDLLNNVSFSHALRMSSAAMAADSFSAFQCFLISSCSTNSVTYSVERNLMCGGLFYTRMYSIGTKNLYLLSPAMLAVRCSMFGVLRSNRKCRALSSRGVAAAAFTANLLLGEVRLGNMSR